MSRTPRACSFCKSRAGHTGPTGPPGPAHRTGPVQARDMQRITDRHKTRQGHGSGGSVPPVRFLFFLFPEKREKKDRDRTRGTERGRTEKAETSGDWPDRTNTQNPRPWRRKGPSPFRDRPDRRPDHRTAPPSGWFGGKLHVWSHRTDRTAFFPCIRRAAIGRVCLVCVLHVGLVVRGLHRRNAGTSLAVRTLGTSVALGIRWYGGCRGARGVPEPQVYAHPKNEREWLV